MLLLTVVDEVAGKDLAYGSSCPVTVDSKEDEKVMVKHVYLSCLAKDSLATIRLFLEVNVVSLDLQTYSSSCFVQYSRQTKDNVQSAVRVYFSYADDASGGCGGVEGISSALTAPDTLMPPFISKEIVLR